MAEETEGRPGTMAYVGCGCGCLGGLVAIASLMILMAVVLGALEGGALSTYGSGGGLCLGIVGGLVGIVLYVMGQNKGE